MQKYKLMSFSEFVPKVLNFLVGHCEYGTACLRDTSVPRNFSAPRIFGAVPEMLRNHDKVMLGNKLVYSLQHLTLQLLA